MYKFVAQNGIRFASSRDLDSVARAINKELKGMQEESFVDDVSSNPRKKELEISLEVVKDVIKTKQSENEAKLNRLKKTAERKKILDALAAKRDQALTASSIEDLEKQLAALEDAG